MTLEQVIPQNPEVFFYRCGSTDPDQGDAAYLNIFVNSLKNILKGKKERSKPYGQL